eukprot:gene18457-24937_t
MDIPCGTKNGVKITFGSIEVVNRLSRDYVYGTILEYGTEYDKTWIFDKIHHEINQFCSVHSLQEVYIDLFDKVDDRIKDALQVDCDKYAPGLEIIAVRITKPIVPDAIMQNYIAREIEHTKVLVAVERQKVVAKEIETERTRAVAEAQKHSDTSRIHQEAVQTSAADAELYRCGVVNRGGGGEGAEAESLMRQEGILDKIQLAKKTSAADAELYRAKLEAEANAMKLTPEFLEWQLYLALTSNTKIFFGEKIPNMIVDQGFSRSSGAPFINGGGLISGAPFINGGGSISPEAINRKKQSGAEQEKDGNVDES